MRTAWIYVACVLGCVAVGVLAAFAGGAAGDRYTALHGPAWAPSQEAQGLVWMLVYVTMGVALGGVLTKGGAGVPRAVAVFVAQLIVNAAWGVIFIRFGSIVGGLIDLVVLWLLVGWTVAAFWSVRDWTGVLLLPYWAWATFSLAINAAIWRMN